MRRCWFYCIAMFVDFACVGATTVPIRPFAVPATFQTSTLDSRNAGCFTGRTVTLTLHASGTYVERVIITGREQYEGGGGWRYDARNMRLILSTDVPERPDYYGIDSATSLERLADDGRALRCSRLTRASHLVDFAGSMIAPTLTSDTWTLEDRRGFELVLPIRTKRPYLRFDQATKRVSGWTGCNTLAGTFTQDGSRLSVSALSATHFTCAPPFTVLEARLLDALGRSTSFHICCSTLELRAGDVLLATLRTSR